MSTREQCGESVSWWLTDPPVPANDNAFAQYLESDCAQHAELRSLLTAARLAKCGFPLSADQLISVQRILETGSALVE